MMLIEEEEEMLELESEESESISVEYEDQSPCHLPNLSYDVVDEVQ